MKWIKKEAKMEDFSMELSYKLRRLAIFMKVSVVLQRSAKSSCLR